MEAKIILLLNAHTIATMMMTTRRTRRRTRRKRKRRKMRRRMRRRRAWHSKPHHPRAKQSKKH